MPHLCSSESPVHRNKANAIGEKHTDVGVITDDNTILSSGSTPIVADTEPCGGGADKLVTEDVIVNISDDNEYDDTDDMDLYE